MRNVRTILFVFLTLGACVWITNVYATSYLTHIKNLLSTSAPSASTNQTITFRSPSGIPASGSIRISFEEGGFVIPPSGFNFGDIDLGFSAVPGGPYTQRPLAGLASAGTDGVSVVTGTAGRITITLNSMVGIPAGSEVQIKLGTHASQGAIGNTQMSLSGITDSYPVTITTYAPGGVEVGYGRTMIAVIDQVRAGPVDTTDQTPPIILSSAPQGILQFGTRGVQMYLETNEPATCRYATSSMAYAVMPYQFTSTSTTGLAYWHFSIETGLTDDTEYLYYVRCIDFRFNEIDPDYLIDFVVGIAPGSSTSTATSTGTSFGSGTGTTTATSTCVGPECVGTGAGTGTGVSGTGSGSSPTGGDGSGSSSGGGGGSGGANTASEVATMLPQAGVRITGWGHPNGTVSIMRDGKVAKSIPLSSDGAFSYVSEQLDRGSYTYMVSGIDSDEVQGASYSTTLWIQSDTISSLSNVMLPPTVTAKEPSVSPGSPVTVSGYTLPGALLTISLRPRLTEISSGDVVATTTAESTGRWTLTMQTTTLSQGTYEVVAQAKTVGGIETDKSKRLTIGVGVDVSNSGCIGIGDLNCDGKVDLVDFSILLFNWNTASAVADVNGDGVVSLPDFSILLFNWTR